MQWSDLRDLAGTLGLSTSESKPGQRNARPRRPNRPHQHGAPRPDSLVEMVGQDRARTMLTVEIRGAALSGIHPGHTLLYGPPGLGKTSLAELIASLAGGQIIRSVGSQISSPEIFVSTVGNLRWADQQNRPVVDTIFVDEIHRLPPRISELFYMAMEDGRIEFRTGRGQNARVESMTLPPFILVGATTLPGYLEQPFRDRFSLQLSLEYYSVEELLRIITNAAESQSVKLDPDAALMLAERSRATPRVALRLLKTAKNFAYAVANSSDVPVTMDTVAQSLDLEEIDILGLDRDDRAVLLALCGKHRGGPVGEGNLSASSGIDDRTVREAIEPYLIRAGLMNRTPRGRVATEAAFDHLNATQGLELECPAHLRATNAHGEPWAE